MCVCVCSCVHLCLFYHNCLVGFFVGQEGPMVYIGSVIGAGVPQVCVCGGGWREENGVRPHVLCVHVHVYCTHKSVT